MKFKYLLAATAAVVLSMQVQAASQSDANMAISAAKQAQSAAAAMHAEWRDTGKLIKGAEEAAAAGDFAKAVSLAKKAEGQGQVAVSQAESQKDVGNPDYLYN